MLSVHVANLMLGNLGFWVFSFLYLGLIYYGDFLDLCSYIDVTTPLQAYHVDVLHELQTTQSSPARKEALHSDSLRNFSPPHSSHEREAESSYRKDAKKFWDHFTLQKNSASEEVVLPIKTDEMHQETCWTLPFSQGIVHENCEKAVVQNNLCFGKCNSFHVPGPEDRLYTFCSHCLPAKFNLKRLELNCTKSVPIVKVVVIVEECKCEIQKTKGPEMGPLHSDLHANVYGHN
ncbi:cerberus isoform X3 [Alligator sinensis]|uniref:Cerberus isoform X3 n=1 Tax=Alligator sinensis TaxID=38654 RepID=A0A1U7S9L2_ALLSI|nr:cerberus isoform X3 [Alligator sinensis]